MKLLDRFSSATFFERWSLFLLLPWTVLTPLMFYGAAKAVQSNSNKVEDWLPASFVETRQLVAYKKYFPTDEFVLVSWEGCRLRIHEDRLSGIEGDDPRLARLAACLGGSNADSRVDEDRPSETNTIDAPVLSKEDQAAVARYIKSVLTSRQLLDHLADPDLDLSIDDAVSRLEGTMVGPGRLHSLTRQGCLVVTLTPEAGKELRQVLGRDEKRLLQPNARPGLLFRLAEQCGIPVESMHIGGPPVDSISIDEEGEKTLIRLAGLSVLLGLGLAWWSLRSLTLTAIVFSCGILSAVTSLAIVWICGDTMDAIMLSMPSLIYVLSISGSIHVINYYRGAVLEQGIEGAVQRAVIHSIKPAILCSVTTAIGLVSLYTSDLHPIRKFGVYSAAGVMVMLLILFLLLPSALQISKVGRRWIKPRLSDGEANDNDWQSSVETPAHSLFWGSIVRRIVLQYDIVLALSTSITVLAAFGLFMTQTSVNLMELFDDRARILQDYRWLEANIGKLVPMEVVVRFSPESQAPTESKGQRNLADTNRLTLLERLETVSLIQRAIDAEFGEQGSGLIGQSMSIATFTRRLPGNTADMLTEFERTAFNDRLTMARGELVSSGFLAIDSTDKSELWRISLRAAAFRGVDYGAFVGEIRSTVQPIIAAQEYRVQILSWLAQQRPGNVFGSRIMIWEPKLETTIEELRSEQFKVEKRQIKKQGTGRVPKVASEGRPSYQCRALRILLLQAGLRVVVSQADPAKASEQQVELLKSTDAIVMLGPPSVFAPELANEVNSKRVNLSLSPVDERWPETSTRDPWDIREPIWINAFYTGVIPIVYKAQRELLNSLMQSAFLSFITITPLLMFVSRGVFSGLVAMLPNVFPVIFVFGGMGWLGLSIDIGSMMTASIALGVAVDDTIHFLSWYRDSLDRLHDRKLAIIDAYAKCGTPTLQSALISGLGLSVFAFSTFTPTQRFGWLMLTILITGVIAELVMLPAILASPMGKLFHPTINKSQQKQKM